MKRSLLLSLLALTTAGSFNALAQQTPAYNQMTLPEGTSPKYFRGSIYMADINSDGLMDVIAKGRNLNNGWAPEVFALTAGSDGLLTHVGLPSDGEGYERTLTAFDYNNDGHVDYLLASAGQELYRNNGDGTFTKVEGFSLEDNFNISEGDGTHEQRYMGLAQAADFDNDGYQDLVVSDKDGNAILYKNNGGTGTFTKMDAGLAAARNGSIAVGDYNRDGLMDILVTGWSDEAGGDALRICKNLGNGRFQTIAPAGVNGTEKGQTIFVDFNNDGLLDLFVTGEQGQNGWRKTADLYKNNGDDTFTKVEASLTPACKGGAEWIDVNGDGLIDIIYSGEKDGGALTSVVINEGDDEFTGHDDLLVGVRSGSAVAAYDLNGNGFPNIAAMGYADNQCFYLYNGLCSRNANTAPNAPLMAQMAEDAGDGKTTFTWLPATDKTTPAKALRYNVYVRLKDGSLITNVPADPATGTLRLGDVNAALSSCTYTLNIEPKEVAEWGVQAIDAGKTGGRFSVGNIDAIQETAAEAIGTVKYADGTLVANVNDLLYIYNAAGSLAAAVKVEAGRAAALRLPAGIYLVKGDKVKTAKVLVK